jgi:murein tripeptide amidase MpaA
MKTLMILLVGLCLFSAGEARKSYEGHQVLSVVPTNSESAEFLHRLHTTDDEVDFWKESKGLGQEVHIMVGPSHLAEIKQQLTEANIPFGVHISNVEDQVAAEAERLAGRNIPGQHVFNINDFNSVDDIYSWLQSLTTQCPAGVNCELYSIGNSYEGRPLNVFKISKTGTGRKAYWIDSLIHAREWIAGATVLQVIDHLVTQGDATAVDLVDRYDWYFLAVQNPDGYSYTWSDDRMWRKNRRPNSGSVCIGTDLNRNFDFRWGTEGVSHSPCAENFCGESGGSEPETQATSAELNRIGSTVAAVVTVHSYGYMWMFPWGNTIDYAGRTCQRSDDHDEVMVVAEATANAIEDTWGTDRWARGNSCEVIYATTGGTDDYSKGVPGIKYAFCPELRGNSFVISADQIPESFQEFYNGIVAMVNTINA